MKLFMVLKFSSQRDPQRLPKEPTKCNFESIWVKYYLSGSSVLIRTFSRASTKLRSSLLNPQKCFKEFWRGEMFFIVPKIVLHQIFKTSFVSTFHFWNSFSSLRNLWESPKRKTLEPKPLFLKL